VFRWGRLITCLMDRSFSALSMRQLCLPVAENFRSKHSQLLHNFRRQVCVDFTENLSPTFIYKAVVQSSPRKGERSAFKVLVGSQLPATGCWHCENVPFTDS
jgi:hypothetical protein